MPAVRVVVRFRETNGPCTRTVLSAIWCAMVAPKGLDALVVLGGHGTISAVDVAVDSRHAEQTS